MNSRVEVVVFGEAVWDLFPEQAGQPIHSRSIEIRHPGGAPANLARTLARLGIRTSLVTALSHDALGQAMIDCLNKCNVDTTYIVRVPQRTGITFVEVRHDGERSFLAYRNQCADMSLTPEQLQPSAFDAAWLHIGSSTFASLPIRESTLQAIQFSKQAGAFLSIDVNARPYTWSRELLNVLMPYVENADVLKVSEEDLTALGFESSLQGAHNLHQVRQRANGRYGQHAITFFTRGAQGAVGFWGDLVIEQNANTCCVVDATGAGDAFMAGALAVLVRHSQNVNDVQAQTQLLAHCLSIGCTLGTLAVTQLGATTALDSINEIQT